MKKLLDLLVLAIVLVLALPMVVLTMFVMGFFVILGAVLGIPALLIWLAWKTSPIQISITRTDAEYN